MKKTTLDEIIVAFRNYNVKNNVTYGIPSEVPKITAIIVYKQSNFTQPYTELERSYRISNTCGKAFFPNMLGNSITGDCLDGKDLKVRLDRYFWDIAYCYFE